MKIVMRLIFILMIFFTSLAANAGEIGFAPSNISNSIVIENLDTKIANYTNCITGEQIVMQNNSVQETYINSLKDNQNFSFGFLGNKYFLPDSQFSLMLSYMYFKSYYGWHTDFLYKTFLTEINPNAPNSLFV